MSDSKGCPGSVLWRCVIAMMVSNNERSLIGNRQFVCNLPMPNESLTVAAL